MDINTIEFPYTTPVKDQSKLHWENISTEIFVRVENKNILDVLVLIKHLI